MRVFAALKQSNRRSHRHLSELELPRIRRVKKYPCGHGLATAGPKSAGLTWHSGRRHLSNAEN